MQKHFSPGICARESEARKMYSYGPGYAPDPVVQHLNLHLFFETSRIHISTTTIPMWWDGYKIRGARKIIISFHDFLLFWLSCLAFG